MPGFEDSSLPVDANLVNVLQFLLAVSENFGDSYLVHIMLPVFLVAIGDNSDLTFFPSTIHSRIKGMNLQIL